MVRADRPRGRQGGVLPHRVAGCRDGVDAVAAQQHGQADAHETERGLGVLGQPQLIVVGGGQQPAKVDVGGRGAPVAEVADLRVGQQLGPHARLLGALAGVDEGDFRAYAVFITSRPL